MAKQTIIDIINEQGTGGKSIYGEKFEDENFVKRHTKKYLLSMANAGRNTNGSQFFITVSFQNTMSRRPKPLTKLQFTPTPHLDGKHVVFGEVVEGQDIVDRMEQKSLDQSGRTSGTIVIAKSGDPDKE